VVRLPEVGALKMIAHIWSKKSTDKGYKLKLRPMLALGDGIPVDVRTALERHSVRFTKGRRCSIAWKKLSGSDLLDIDQENRQIILNTEYRSMLLRGAHGGKTDLPLLRTILYWTFEPLLSGDRIGAVERLRLEAIKVSMNAALKLEKQWAKK
jgi:hypothetical protein